MSHLDFKKHLAFLFFFFLFLSISISQDTITTRDGAKIECKVLEIDLPKIKYRLKSQPDGPIRNIESSNISTIEYADGAKEFFKEEKQTAKSLREYKPFSIGLSSGLGFIPTVYHSANMLSFGYQLKHPNLRFVVDGIFLLRSSGLYSTFTFNLHYIVKIAKGKFEFFPELGAGLFTYSGANFPIINVGLGLDYRSSNFLSFFVHTRYQMALPIGRGGIFSLNLGARFRFGGNKKK